MNDTFQSVELSLDSVAERVLMKAIHDNWLNQQSNVLTPLVHGLCRLRKIDSIFKLVSLEKQRMLSDFERLQRSFHMNGSPLPESHTWVLDKLDRTMIKTDDPFVHNNCVWSLGLNYYR